MSESCNPAILFQLSSSAVLAGEGVLTDVLTLRPSAATRRSLVTLYASSCDISHGARAPFPRLVGKTMAAAKERRHADMGYEHGPSDYVVLKVRSCISARGAQKRVCKLTPRMPQTCSCRSAVRFSFWTYYGSSAPTRANEIGRASCRERVSYTV